MRVFKLTALIPVIFLFIASSCITPRKLDKKIGEHYGNTIPDKGRKSDFINFRFENSIPESKLSSSAKTRNKVVPALFYWKWDLAQTATLNSMMPMSNFTSSFVTEANAQKLKEKLDGAVIDITITTNPGDFHLRDQGWLVYLLVAYIGKDKFYVDPVYTQFSVSYTVNYPSGEKKSGNLSTENINMKKTPRFFQSFKGMVSEYLTACDANIKLMAKDLAGQLYTELVKE